MRCLPLLLLAACTGPDDTDPDVDPDTNEGTDVDSDTADSAFIGVTFTATWSGAGLDFDVLGGSGQYLLGMAETGAGIGGWFGENCVGGAAGYDYCHAFAPPGVVLATVGTPDDVIEGESTLFTAAEASDITYIVIAPSSECVVWGHDPTYYDGLGCEERSP